MKDPLHGQPAKKRAYVVSALIWVASNCARVIIYSSWIWTITQNRSVDYGIFVCFGLTSVRINDRGRFICVSFYVITFWIISSIITVITLSNFVRILLELRELKKYHLCLANELNTSTVVRRYKPINRTGEERTAKSLILIYFIQFSCVFVSYLMYYIQMIRNFVYLLRRKMALIFKSTLWWC